MKAAVIISVLFICVLINPVFAEENIDGTKSLICATIQAVRCVPGEECERGLAESIGAPQFMRIDFSKKEIVGPKHTTQIRLMEKSDGQITLQGFELGMGWVLALHRGTGKATITFAGSDEGFVIFAACTTP
jgi:hypothetical protein